MPNTIKPLQAPARGNFPVIPMTQAPNVKLDSFYSPKYDKNYRPGMVQSFNRSDNQAWTEQLGYGLLSRSASIATKTLAGLGSVGYGLTVPFTENTLEDIWNNPITQWGNQLDEELGQILPVFQSQKYAEGQLLQKMLTTSFWATDAMDGLAFAASAYLPGAAIGKGLTALKSATSGAKMFNGLKGIIGEIDDSLVSAARTFGDLPGGMPTRKFADAGVQALDDALNTWIARPTAQAALGLREALITPIQAITKAVASIQPHQANLVLATAYNTVAEAAAEAYQTQKELQSIYEGQGYSPEEAKLKSAKAAREVFGANAAILAIPNFIQNSFFHGSWGSKVSSVRKAAIESEGSANAQQFLSGKWKDIAGGFVSEGLWEENAQTSVQQYERALAKGFVDEGFMSNVVDNMYSNMKGFAKSILPGDYDISPDENEGALSIALGSMLGMGFGAMSAYSEAKNINELVKNENQTYQDFAKNVVPAAFSTFRENFTSILKKDGTTKIKDGDKEVEVPNYIIDEKGNYQLNEAAVNALVHNSLKDHTFWSLEMLAAMNNNQTLGSFNKELALASYAYTIAQGKGIYSKEDAKAVIEKTTKTADAESKKLGIDTMVKENMTTVTKYLDEIEKTNNKYKTAEAIKDPSEYRFRDFLAKTDLYLQAKLAAVARVRQEHENLSPELADSLTKVEQDAMEHMKILKEQPQKVRSLYDNLVARNESMRRELNTLEQKKEKTQEEFDKVRELEFLINEDDFINGKFAAEQTGHVENPIGIHTSRLVQTRPGVIDDFNFQIGQSWVSLRKAQQALNQPVPDLEGAEREFSRINTDQDPDMMSETAGRIVDLLDEAASSLQASKASIETWKAAADEVNNTFEVEEGQLAKDLFSQEVLTTFEIDPETEITEDLLAGLKDEIFSQTENLSALEKQTDLALQRLEQKKNFIQDYQSRIDENNSEATKFKNSTNKEMFLKKKFFDRIIKEPVVAYIEDARENKETIDSLDRAEFMIRLLKDTIVAYTNRKDANNPDVVPEAKALLETLENEILGYINKNLNNRKEVQVETNNKMTTSILEALKSNAELRELIKTILGTTTPEAKEFEVDGIVSFDAISVFLHHVKSKASKDELAKLDSVIDGLVDNTLTDIYNAIPEEYRNRVAKSAIESQLLKGNKWYKNNPGMEGVKLIRWMFKDKVQEQVSSLLKLGKDFDLLAFSRGLNTNKDFSDVEKQFLSNLLDKHFRLYGFSVLKSIINSSELSAEQFLDLKEKLDLEQYPSLQQKLAIEQTVQFLFSEVGTDQYDNWIISNGIGGSGKSFVVGNLAPKLWAQLSKKDLAKTSVAFSRSQITSDNINKSVYGSSNPNSNFEKFMEATDEQLSKWEVIIIDEIYTFSNKEIEAIQNKIQEFVKNNPKASVPKVIALGDFSQISAEVSPTLQKVFAAKAKQTLPLTVTFRTNVDAIAVFANSFRMKATPVRNLFTTASTSVESIITDPSRAFGVASMDEVDLIAALNSPSSRSRVLIVPLEADKANYSRILPQISVVTPQEAQGIQWDEVYAIANPLVYGEDEFEVNQVLYTIASRAKSLLVVSGLDSANTAPKTDMELKLSQEDEIIEFNKDTFTKSVSQGRKMVEALNGVPILTKDDMTKKKEVVAEDEDEIPLAPEDEEIVSSFEPVTIEVPEEKAVVKTPSTKNEFIHTLRFPRNKSLHPVEVNGKKVSPIPIGSTAHIIKTTRKKGDAYYVIAPNLNNQWVVLGMLSDADFKAQPKFSTWIQKEVTALPGAAINEEAPFHMNMSQVESASVGTMTVYGTERFRTNFGVTYETDDTLASKGLDVVEDVIMKFYNTFYGIDEDGVKRYPGEVYTSNGLDLSKDWVKNGKPNWEVLRDKVQLRIMTKKEASKAGLDNYMLGLPYVVISEARQQGSDVQSVPKPYYIQLQPKGLDKDSAYLQPIRELRDSIKLVESILGDKFALGTEALSNAIDQFARANFTLDVSTDKLSSGNAVRSIKPNQQITPASKFLGVSLPQAESEAIDEAFKKIVGLTYGIKKKLIVFDSKKEAKEYLKNNSQKNDDGTWTLTSQDISKDTGLPMTFTIVDIAEHGKKFVFMYASSLENKDKAQRFQDYAIRRGEGAAQHKLNALAMANKSVGEIPFRIQSTTTKKGRIIKLTRSKSIFSTKESLDVPGFLSDPRVIDSGWSNDMYDPKAGTTMTTQAIATLQTKYGFDEAVKIVRQYTSSVMTSDVLDAIVDESQFVNNQHVALRTPLHLHTFDWSGINDIGTQESKAGYSLDDKAKRKSLTSNLSSNFTSMTRTQIRLSSEVSVNKPTQIKKKSNKSANSVKVTELLETMPISNAPQLERIKELLNKIEFLKDTDVYFQDFVINEGKRISLVQQNTRLSVTHTSSQYSTGVAILTSIAKEDIDKGSKAVVETLYHEMLHAATQAALAFGEQSPESKEGLFYQRLSELQKIFNAELKKRGIEQKDIYGTTISELNVHEFVANMSNPKFVKLAKDIKLGKQSLLNKIIEAIVNFFGGETNVYEATIAAIEDYYDMISINTSQAVETVVVDDNGMSKPIEDEIESIAKLLAQIEDEELIGKYLLGIFDVSAYKKDKRLVFNKLFAKKTMADQLTTLNSLTNIIIANSNNLQFAIYNRPKAKVISVKGGTLNLKGLEKAISFHLPFWNGLEQEHQNIIYSLLHTQLTSAGSTFLDNLFEFVEREDKASLVSTLWNEVLSNQDRIAFKGQLELSDDKAIVEYLIANQNSLYDTFHAIVKLLSENKDSVEKIVGSIHDRMPFIYKEAKNYIMDIIRENQKLRDSTTHRMLTRFSLYKEVANRVKSANTNELKKELSELEAELDQLRKTDSSSQRYFLLLYDLVPAIQNKILGIESLQTRNIRTGNLLVEDIYRDLYPRDPLSKMESMEIAMELAELEDAVGDVDENIKEAVNINEYIKEYNKSYELTLSESLKDFLAGAAISTGGTQKYLSPALMYIKLLQIVATLEISSTDKHTSLENLQSQLQKKLAQQLSDVDRTVMESLLREVEGALDVRRDFTRATTIVTGTDAGGNTWYAAAIHTEGVDISDLTYEELRSTKGVSVTNQTQASDVLFKEFARINSTLTIAQFNHQLSRAESINVMRGIMNTMASMKETDLYIGVRSYQGGLSLKMIRSKASGITFNIKDTIKHALSERYNEGTLFTEIASFYNGKINGKPAKTIPESGTTADKLEYIKRFYHNIADLQGINVGVSIASDPTGKLQDYVTQIANLLQVAMNVNKTVVDTRVDEVLSDETFVPEDVNDDSFLSFINNIDGYLTRLSEFASLSSDYLRNPSVRTLRGDRYYKWHESSFAADVLFAMTDLPSNVAVVRGATGHNSARRIPPHLTSSFYNHNIFVRGKVTNKVHAVGEWEGSLNEDNGSGTEYLRENYNFFYQKKFLQGFLDNARQFRDQYTQFVYIPSDKPKHPLARIEILKDSAVKDSIIQALNQILESKSWRAHVENYNKSVTNDPFRNFTIGKEALDELGVEFNESNIEKIATKAVEILERRASEALDRLLTPDVEIRLPKDYHKTYDALKFYLNPKYKDAVISVNDSGNFDGTKKDGYQSRLAEIKKMILPSFELFYKNNYVNGYFMNQLIAGDYAAFKSSIDIVKRYGGVFGPGIRGLVDEKIGMKEDYKVLILEDTHVDLQNTRDALHKLFFADKQPSSKDLEEFERVLNFFDAGGYDMTDAQGFMTPSRYKELGRGFERSWYRGAIHKPVHFEVQSEKVRDAEGNVLLNAKGTPITTAIARYTKYSSVVLSDEMLNAVNSPLLRKLRDNLEKGGWDEVIFKSGIKEGAPFLLDQDGKPLFTNEKGEHRWMNFSDFVNADEEFISKLSTLNEQRNDPNFKGSSGTLNLSNRHFRLQHNPASDPNKNVSIYTQLMYFLNVFSNSSQEGVGLHPSLQKQADEVYSLIGDLIKMGREEFITQVSTPAKMRSFLQKKFADSPNSERVAELIEAKLSLNNPLIERKSIIAIASGMEANTVRVKFSGGKLVLQSAEGVETYSEGVKRELAYKVETINGKRVMVAEVIVPEAMLTPEMKESLASGSPMYMFGDGMGFRIPSTELHSAVPLRIVGTYSPAGKSNVIIAPKELVPIHGSDFDVDALFVIMRETFTEDETIVLSSESIINYQKALVSIIRNIEAINKDGAFTSYLNDLKVKLGLEKDEEAEEFVSQEELYDRYTEYVSTPQFDPSVGTDVVRADLPDFFAKELLYKRQWGKLNGYKMEKDPATGDWIWKLQIPLIAAMYELQQQAESAPEVLQKIVKKALKENPINQNSLVGNVTSPVAYKKNEQGIYVLDKEVLPALKAQLAKLEDLSDAVHVDVRSLVLPSIKNSINRTKSLIKKATKNTVTDIMLSIITDIDNNGWRMTTPINFTPLREAVDQLNLPKGKPLDLSDLESEYGAFYSLSSGQVLTGAFANAVKDFAYLTQAGDAQENAPLVEALTSAEEEYDLARATLESLKAAEKAQLTPEETKIVVEAETTVKELAKKVSEAKKNLTIKRVRGGTSTRTQINKKYHFKIGDKVFNSLETRDKAGKYNITETFDTLINAAIDNLKLGLLGEAKINTQTGSAVVGGVFLGVPLSTVVKILYQPILAPITTGISDKKDQYMRDIIKDNEDAYRSLDAYVTEEELQHALSLSTNPKSWTEPEKEMQLRVMKIFANMNKIGEDASKLSSFLSIIRDMQVTVEKLDALDANLKSNIGIVSAETGVLTPKADFAFVAPNLLANTPHVLEAYRTHKTIQNLVSKNFLLHSEQIRRFAERVNENLGLDKDDVIKNASDNLADIRKALAHYLLAEVPWKKISENNKPSILNFKTKGKDVKVVLSITRTFLQKTADQLKAVQDFAIKNNIKNMFLENVFIGQDRMGVPMIQFRGGVNLHPEDHQQIAIDFRNLNRFQLSENNTVSYADATPFYKSPLQEALVNYAIVAYGLSYGSSNFSIYIPPTFLQSIDKKFNESLKELTFKVQEDKKALDNTLLNHFRLSYVTQNVKRLPFIDYKDVTVTEKVSRYERRKNGMDTEVELSTTGPKGPFTKRNVFFDMKVSFSDKTRFMPQWIKEGSGKRIIVYKLVGESTTHGYYQKVGKISDLYYTPLNQKSYEIGEYYTPDMYTLSYFNREKNIVYSGSAVSHFLKPGDFMYIAPFYNFDRIERTLVKIKGVEKLTDSKFPGYRYTIEEVEEGTVVSPGIIESIDSNREVYEGRITALKENEVFVFGSNPLGINGNPSKGTGGAALVAHNIAGVKQGEKMDNKLSDSGKAWGITTVAAPGAKRSKTSTQIQEGIKQLYDYAVANPDKRFLIAYQGKTGHNLNGYSNQELANMFSAFVIPENIIFEKEFSTLIAWKDQNFKQQIEDLGIQKVCE